MNKMMILLYLHLIMKARQTKKKESDGRQFLAKLSLVSARKHEVKCQFRVGENSIYSIFSLRGVEGVLIAWSVVTINSIARLFH